MLPYRTQEEFQIRVDQCVIMMGTVPIWVNSILPDLNITYHLLPYAFNARTPGRIAGNDPSLEAHNLRLGYMNLQDGCFYATRMPARRTHQGLCDGNVTINTGRRLSTTLKDEGAVRTFQGFYPTFKQVIEQITAKNSELLMRAFSRRWALQYNPLMESFTLDHRNVQIATSLDGEKFKLPSKFAYLREAVEELDIKVA